MKTDLTCYENKKILIDELMPGPRYPDKAMKSLREQNRIRNSKASLERIRTSGISKQRAEARFYKGRIEGHFKLEQLRKEVAAVRAEEKLNTNKKVKIKEGIRAPDVQIDDMFQLPYGAGYDHIIKAKAEVINIEKQGNIKIMDDLIYKLGYMDYRDALACNKYILETKFSGDY